MAAPVWFDYKAYFNNKLALLNESDSMFDSLGGGYNDLTRKAAFEAAGYSVDADEFVVNKLLDRGSLAATTIVTNVQDFITKVARDLGVYPK